ncbi:hypothetical protein IWW37_003601 [Coemansia sp. RSA 2050]|nr:hypothetical protein IWW37_003601 [Coemansia sp. RSA 2050]KAJ2732493.1 hypothetical protein IW152_003769 [Coemansia sp. BCRC 34962]
MTMPAAIIPATSGSANEQPVAGSMSQLAASTPALSASSDIPVTSNAAALSMASFYDFTTVPSQRHNDISGDLTNSASFDDQLHHSWMQALMAQPGALYQPETNGFALAQQAIDGSPRAGNVRTTGELQTQSSDSDSDDISKSLSYLLNQHINQSGTSAGASQYHGRQQSGELMLPHGGGGVSYSSALNSMLEIGYDGGRRVISMPNPLDSLSLDLPIHPPPSLPPQSVVQPMLGLMPGHLMSGKNAAIMGYRPSTSAGTSTPQYSFLNTGVQMPSSGVAANTAGQGVVVRPGGECVSNFLEFGHSGMTFATTPSFNSQQPPPPPIRSSIVPPPSIELDASKSALGITTGKRNTPNVATRGTKRSVSASVEAPKETGTRNRRSRLPTAKNAAGAASVATRASVAGSKQAALSESKSESTLKLKGGASRDSVFQSPHSAAHSAFATPAMHSALGTPSGMSTPTLASAVSALIPHRVDRQLAEASRPLFFVRPRTSDDQPRRRKRRCVSSGASLSHPTKSNDTSDLGSLAKPGEGEAEEPNLQWQRISEQRRRDAMRENFDLLKRMLPQGYMASDDGRELARPVLLARFLRWVDDTLIEMESLKSEVAHLRLAAQSSTGAASELWQLEKAPAGGVAEAALCSHPRQTTPSSILSVSAPALAAPIPVFGQPPNTLGLSNASL